MNGDVKPLKCLLSRHLTMVITIKLFTGVVQAPEDVSNISRYLTVCFPEVNINCVATTYLKLTHFTA